MEKIKFNQEIIQEINLEDKNVLKLILEFFKYDKANVISILQKIQEHYRYLPTQAIFYLSKKLKMSPSEIYSVATFYTQFRFNDIGKNLIICCDGTACHIKGIRPMISFLEDYLGISSGETTADKIFSLETVACLGCCAISPVCIINGKIFGNLTTNKVRLLLKNLSKENKKD